jgi:hypothetical protein
VDRERVLVLLAAGVDALVTEDALPVVADVELVVDLHGLVHGRGGAAVRLDVMTRARAVAVGRGRGGAEALRRGLVPAEVARRDRRRREVDRRCEQLQHKLAREPHTLGVGVHHHPRLHLAGARGDENARALDLDDADAAYVRRPERLPVAERRGVDPEPRAGIEDRRALEHADRLAVDLELDHALRREQLRHAGSPWKT